MGVYTFIVNEETSSVTPARLYKALCLDNHNFLPKVLPNVIKSIDFVEGNSTAVGCVKQYNFVEGGPYKFVKDQINELDVDNYYVKFTNIEGDSLGDSLESVVYEFKMESSGSGTHYKMIAHFHTKADAVVNESDEIVKTANTSMTMVYKAVEEYLCNNPEVYA